MVVVDAGVEDGDLEALAGHAFGVQAAHALGRGVNDGGSRGRVGRGGCHGWRRRLADEGVLPDRCHVGGLKEPIELLARDRQGETVVGVGVGLADVVGHRLGGERVGEELLEAALGLFGLALGGGCGEHPAGGGGPSLLAGGGALAQLDDDVDGVVGGPSLGIDVDGWGLQAGQAGERRALFLAQGRCCRGGRGSTGRLRGRGRQDQGDAECRDRQCSGDKRLTGGLVSFHVGSELSGGCLDSDTSPQA